MSDQPQEGNERKPRQPIKKTFVYKSHVLAVVVGDGSDPVLCPECKTKRRPRLLWTHEQTGLLESIFWEVVECRACHHRYVIESLVENGE
jgi:hypothetical protein